MKIQHISEDFVSQLDDWEIISAYSYTEMILSRRNLLAREEFEDMKFFFFNGDSAQTLIALRDAKNLYNSVFSKRHAN